MNLTLNVYHDVRRGGRNYMEDVIAIVTHIGDQSEPYSHPFVCFLVFDGHGGVEAAKFSEENLLNEIKAQEGFNSDDDELVVEAIKKGFLSTHQSMWKVIGTWPKTQHGLPSTSGTTASMVLIRKGKLYVAHVGDSTVMLAEQGDCGLTWKARVLTTDHKPDLPKERQRIEMSGGEVMLKSGVPRVVWRRERSIKLPNKKVSSKDCVPFLAVARSLGDLWSYNESTEMYSVSPEPDVSVHNIDLSQLKCLILASDGLWNVLSATETIKIVMKSLNATHQSQLKNDSFSWLNIDPAMALIDVVMAKCRDRYLRADNTSVIVVLFE
ncbi:hypothetical protein HELRODRAFT_71441, partial [Helobdella robusta]|uniref:PPM-type phosphatase domain-containing protein n=1 Tax=Helobdella robusta TaxID=6412 RepID=T1G0L8_HELRO